MHNNRIEQLKQFLAESPEDPFNIYALALEYSKEDIGKALGFFEQLLKEHPDYLPSYYQAAALYAEIGEIERTQEIYALGIALSKKQENHHTLKELERAWEQFKIEEDL